MAAERLGAELRSQDDPMLDQIPTEVTNHSNARTDGVRRRPFVPDALTGIPVLSRGSSDMLGGPVSVLR